MNCSHSLRWSWVLLLMVCWTAIPETANAQGRTVAIRETTEWVLQRFGRQAAKEGAHTLAVRLERYAAQHGDDFLQAIRKVGPRAFHLVDEAGPQAAHVIGIMSRHGEKGIVNIVSRPQALKLVTQLGETAEAALVKHPAIAEKMLASHGAAAAHAMQTLGAQGGRRLAMLSDAGELAKLGRTEELLTVIGRYGEKAMQFIWENKGTLAVTGAMTAFLANPEPFLEGTVKLTSEVISSAIKPLAEIPKVIAEHAAASIDWTLVVMTLIGLLTVWLGWKYWRQRPQPQPNMS